jgi:vitamin B12 transporter
MKIVKISIIATTLITSLSATTDLEKITITTASKTNQLLSDTTSDIDVITASDIEARGFQTLPQALNTLAGFDIVSNGGFGKTTSTFVRGMDNNRVLVLVDGVRYKDPSNTSGAQLEHIMLSNVEKIEVVKGAQSGIWGADAAAGVINIITKTPKDGVNASLFAEYGSYNTKRYGVNLGYKEDQFFVNGSVSKLDSDGFTTLLPKGKDADDFEDDGYENTTISLSGGINITEDSQLQAHFTNIDALSDYDSNGANDSNMSSDTSTNIVGVQYSQQLDNHNITAKYDLSNFDRVEKGTTKSAWGESVLGFEGELTNIELNDKVDYSEGAFAILGLAQQITDVTFKKTDASKGSDEYENQAIYLTNSNKFGGSMGGDTILTESIRYDKYDHFDNKVTGKIGLKHFHENINDFTTFANYGTAYNAPNIIQILNPWGGANPKIQPESIKSYDIGFEYAGARVTYFNQEIDDLIDYVSDPVTFIGSYDNVSGTSTIKGFEVSYQTNILDETLVSMNYTNLSAEDKDGKTLARRAKNHFKMAVDYYGVDKLHLGVDGEYVGDREDNAFDPVTFKSSKVQTGKYALLNLSASYDLLPELNIYTRIDNALDRDYQSVYGYATSARAYYAGFRYGLK